MRFPKLFERLATLAPLPPEEWAKAETLAKEQSLAKRELFMRPGDAADRFAVVLQGVFRGVRVSPRGGESIKAFRAEGELIGAYAEMLQRRTSMTAIEALEPSRVLVFQTRDFQALEQGHVCWERLARRVAEQHFLLKERREQEFLELSAEERLVNFWEEHPHLKGRIPQRDVAAYLGITEVGLSRIMSRRRKRAAD
ncbi:cyclic nucleotide-binding domain-containing protein [Corallococcus coralloides DSM 2259]|uniref:Cyclic nucleotide-binding domain-containing protein n=1 Tax=Corallococcus coralloides (strain ATCC 25202 / DSM 2259 / NBRC 100086 / M2) TaxID=1144275 RepID=H8N101_CORCM|nr:Crp/Fnr family transcriptional regulator [Corallococcus coralloides]AFE07175.1 cyclic nucleotide-binding domain-containing protein [Corallococcus coralloides DSM 2259]